jgi:hypothetical protein
MDNVLRKYPECAIILTGDFNRFRDGFFQTHYSLRQLVKQPTRNDAILDKLWTNMSCVYNNPILVGELGTSDHRIVFSFFQCKSQSRYW